MPPINAPDDDAPLLLPARPPALFWHRGPEKPLGQVHSAVRWPKRHSPPFKQLRLHGISHVDPENDVVHVHVNDPDWLTQVAPLLHGLLAQLSRGWPSPAQYLTPANVTQ